MLSLGDSTIPKSTDESRIKENFAASKIQLEDDEIQRMKQLDKGYRRNTYDWLFRPQLDSVETAWDIESDSAFVIENDK